MRVFLKAIVSIVIVAIFSTPVNASEWHNVRPNLFIYDNIIKWAGTYRVWAMRTYPNSDTNDGDETADYVQMYLEFSHHFSEVRFLEFKEHSNGRTTTTPGDPEKFYVQPETEIETIAQEVQSIIAEKGM